MATPGNWLARAVLLIAAASCYASFIWALSCFFRRESTLPWQMQMMRLSGLVGMLSHVGGLLLASTMDMRRIVAALVAYLLSLFLFWWAVKSMWNNRPSIAFSAGMPERLCTVGAYGVVRHPMYMAYSICWFAGALAISEWWAWLVSGLMVVQYVAALRHEERQIAAGPLSEEYAGYRRRVGQLLPNPAALFRSRRR